MTEVFKTINKVSKTDANVLIIGKNRTGIEESELENIFIPFYTTKEEGSGIGLSLARQVMHLHNGNISVDSVPNERTTFTLQF